MRSELKVVVVAVFACASALAATAEEHVAARADALKDCRPLATGERKACDKPSRDPYRRDIASARAVQ